MMRCVGIIASLLFSRALSSDVMRAVFTLEESYAEGTVEVKDGEIMISLNITNLVNSGLLPGGCVIDESSGVLYHVHTKWTNVGGSNYTGGCASSFTGGHYDPYGACGSASGYSYCSTCISSSSSYSCSSGSYALDAYACEVGDWSGKYGAATYEGGIVTAHVQSFGEITGNELIGKSIVFHCPNGGARAFCASFQNTTGTVTDSSREQSNRYKLKADFASALGLSSDKDAYVAMNYDGQVEIKFSPNAFDSLTCPDKRVAAWIGDAWNDGLSVSLSGSECTTSVRGLPYDPTNQCYASETTSDSCINGRLCNSTGYTYSCNYGTNPFSCSPMDLTGRYGSFNISTSGATIQVFDRYMADLTNLLHRSVVLSCVSTGQPLLCAKLQSVAVGTAVATFTNTMSGAEGTVVVTNGRVTVNVSFAYAAANYLNGVDLPATCLSNGLKGHIHEMWYYNDTIARHGSTACGKTYTGGHWDPWAGCSATTGYTSVCSIPPSPSPTACVDIGGSAGNGAYRCNVTQYMENPFLCEVGDWTSKYGTYQFINGFEVQRADYSPMEVDASELVGRSIVFHCNDGTRAFCAPFLLQDDIPDGVDSKPAWPLTTQTGNQILTAEATLKEDEGTITLQSDGYYAVDIDISTDTNCTWTIGYAVFKDSSCTSVYDPTIQCPPISEHDGTYCFTQETCQVTMYYCDWWNAPYSCSPSDLSGKYGETDDEKIRTSSGWDDLMIPLPHLEGKYLGLYCADTWEVIECRPWNVILATTSTSSTSTSTSTSTTAEETTTSTNTETTKSIGHKQSYGVGLILALIMISLLY